MTDRVLNIEVQNQIIQRSVVRHFRRIEASIEADLNESTDRVIYPDPEQSPTLQFLRRNLNLYTNVRRNWNFSQSELYRATWLYRVAANPQEGW